MIRRHPHIFHTPLKDENGNPVTDWKEIKKIEKQGREWEDDFLPAAFREGRELIARAEKRKGLL